MTGCSLKGRVVVIGGGHAGVEAAVAASNAGAAVVLITPSAGKIALMSCNPAIGGIAKGTLVREIDAAGGAMGISADNSALQFRMLNMRKGPSVWGPRSQADVIRYTVSQRERLAESGVEVVEGIVTELNGPSERIASVELTDGRRITGGAFVLAVGTFLGGMLHRGAMSWPGGRRGDISSMGLEESLKKRMFHVKRFKTGTSPRVLRSSVDTAALEEQEEHGIDFRFSWRSNRGIRCTEKCWVTRTTGETESTVRENLHLSPLYRGTIKGKGPRYCPSFEDKVTRFPDRTGHPIHLEPMGRHSRVMYINGLSTSLPEPVQEKVVRSIEGFKNAVIAVYGYSVEYTCFDTGQFTPGLRIRGTENLYAAGQILGTSGYEEAAAAGLLAGANAAACIRGSADTEPDRMTSYLGVMVDDLVSRGTDEPYRLFSGRSENRLYLRQDNADVRMHGLGRRLCTIDATHADEFRRRMEKRKTLKSRIDVLSMNGIRAIQMIKRPETTLEMVAAALSLPSAGSEFEIMASIVLDIKYAGYVERARRYRNSRKRAGEVSLADVEDYALVQSITTEAAEALNRMKPPTLFEAERIPAVRQADLDALVLHLMKKGCST